MKYINTYNQINELHQDTYLSMYTKLFNRGSKEKAISIIERNDKLLYYYLVESIKYCDVEYSADYIDEYVDIGTGIKIKQYEWCAVDYTTETFSTICKYAMNVINSLHNIEEIASEHLKDLARIMYTWENHYEYKDIPKSLLKYKQLDKLVTILNREYFPQTRTYDYNEITHEYSIVLEYE